MSDSSLILADVSRTVPLPGLLFMVPKHSGLEVTFHQRPQRLAPAGCFLAGTKAHLAVFRPAIMPLDVI